MNRKIHVACVAAGAFLVSVLGALAYQSESFEGAVAVPWFASSNIVTSVGSPSPVHLGNSLSIPVMQWVSNAVPANLTNQVWTDFWTIPTVFNADGSADGPTIDSNATVQFFVNSSSNWTVYSGDASHVGYVTNSTSTLVTNHTTFHQVSVLSDYSTHKFSFFVDDVCLLSDLNFMTTNLSAAQWFQVQNLGGAAANVCYLDEYMLTNRLGGSVLTNPVPGGGVSVADAIQYFNTTNNPAPVVTNFGVASDVGTNAMRLGFIPQPEQKYVLLRGLSSDIGTMSGINTVVVSGASALVDENALGLPDSQAFYKVLTVSTVDDSISITNDETYAWFRRDASRSNRWYYSCIPIIYGSLAESSLSNSAGQQLASGLHADASGLLHDLLVVGGNTYSLSATTNWFPVGASQEPGEIRFVPGSGVAIKRQSATVSSPIIFTGKWTNSIAAVAISPNWNLLGWPYDLAATPTSSKFPSLLGDRFVVVRGDSSQTAQNYGSGWKFSPTVDLGESDWPQPGEGFMYYYSGSSPTNWTPSRQ